MVGPKGVDDHAELRYSLRSVAANLDHDRVWIAGHKPSWLTDVGYISVLQRRSKYENSTANVRAACEHPEVSADFVLMNDDFFVTQPMDAVPVLHRGPIADVYAYYESVRPTLSPYLSGMAQTRDLLESLGHTDLLSYEVHVPMPVNKQAMIEALQLAAGVRLKHNDPFRSKRITALHKRTLYGNHFSIGGTFSEDCKVFRDDQDFDAERPFLSTDDVVFSKGRVGEMLRDRFPEPSPYEARVLDNAV